MAKVSLEFDLSEEKIENYIRRFEEMLDKAEEVSTMMDDLESVIERLQKIVKEDEEAKRKARRTVTRKKKEA
jgi:predicted transcriptional regulator